MMKHPHFFASATALSCSYVLCWQVLVHWVLSAKDPSHAKASTVLAGWLMDLLMWLMALCMWLMVLPMWLMVLPSMISGIVHPGTPSHAHIRLITIIV